jgi:hypothetical protein
MKEEMKRLCFVIFIIIIILLLSLIVVSGISIMREREGVKITEEREERIKREVNKEFGRVIKEIEEINR